MKGEVTKRMSTCPCIVGLFWFRSSLAMLLRYLVKMEFGSRRRRKEPLKKEMGFTIGVGRTSLSTTYRSKPIQFSVCYRGFRIQEAWSCLPRRSIILIKRLSQSIESSMIDRLGTSLTLEWIIGGDGWKV